MTKQENSTRISPDPKNESAMINIRDGGVRFKLSTDGLTKSEYGPITDADTEKVQGLIEKTEDPEQIQFLQTHLPKAPKI